MKTKKANEQAARENLRLILGFVPDSKGLDAMTMIRGYEQEAHDILKAGGYPLTLRDLVYSRFDENKNPLKKKAFPPRIRDLMDMLAYFQAVRYEMKKNDFSKALCWMAYGVQAAMKARIRPAEKHIYMGREASKRGQDRRAKRSTWKGLTKAQREERNQKMEEHFKKTNLSPAGFAEKHSTKYGLKPTRVRQILSKALDT